MTIILPVLTVVLGAVELLIDSFPEHQKDKPSSNGIPSGNSTTVLDCLTHGTLTRTWSDPIVLDVPLAHRTQLVADPCVLSMMIDLSRQGPPATFVLTTELHSLSEIIRCLTDRSNVVALRVIHYFLLIALMAFSALSPAM